MTDRLSTVEAASTLQASAHPNEGPLAPNVVIGLGNDIAGDDGAGIAAARILQDRLGHRQDITVVALPWAGFSLLDVLNNRDRAAIIDCLTTGNHPPGTIVRLDENDLGGSVRLNSFHDINYPTAMALGRRLGWKMPTTIAIWGIEAGSFGVFTEDLSPPVKAAVAEVAGEVEEFLAPPCVASLRVPPEGGRTRDSDASLRVPPEGVRTRDSDASLRVPPEGERTKDNAAFNRETYRDSTPGSRE